jgi:C4-dicarboxylate-specific signal transduction histidine kinase
MNQSDRETAALRKQHAALARQRRELQQRTAAPMSVESAAAQLGHYALKSSTAGFALLRDHRVRLGNDKWHELASPSRGGRWVVSDDGEPRTYGDLRALAASELTRLAVGGTATRNIVRTDNRQTLRVRLERLKGADAPSGFVVVEDVTFERARAEELARLRDALVQRERSSALGRVAGGIVHDLGNTVGVLVARLRVAASSDAAGARAQLKQMTAAVDNMRGTLERLHRFSRQGGTPPASVDLAAVIEAAVAMVAPTLGRSGRPTVRIETAISKQLPRVFGHAADLQSVLVNLLINAHDAMPKGGTITVAARSVRGRVVVAVRDEGTGVPPALLPRLFEPFFTTKSRDDRAGLGLSIAHGVVQAAGGSISAANRSEGGLEITLELKAARRPTKRRAR